MKTLIGLINSKVKTVVNNLEGGFLMLANNKSGYVSIMSSMAFILFLIGCMYIPGGRFSEETLATLKVGITTKEEILQLFGEPIILKDKKFFIYEREKGLGDIIILPGAKVSSLDLIAIHKLGQIAPNFFFVHHNSILVVVHA